MSKNLPPIQQRKTNVGATGFGRQGRVVDGGRVGADGEALIELRLLILEAQQ